MFGYLLLVALFVALTPGILFKLKGSKMDVAAMHAVLFGVVVYLVSAYFTSYEGFQYHELHSVSGPPPCPVGSEFKAGTDTTPPTCTSTIDAARSPEPTCPAGSEFKAGTLTTPPTCTSTIDAARSPAPIICHASAAARGFTPNLDGPPRAPLTAGPFCGLWVDKANKWLYTAARFQCPDGGKAVGNYRSTGENRTGTCYTCPVGSTYVGTTKCKITTLGKFTTPAKCPDGYSVTRDNKCLLGVIGGHNELLRVGDLVVCKRVVAMMTIGVTNPITIDEITSYNSIGTKKTFSLRGVPTIHTTRYPSSFCYPVNAFLAEKLYSEGRISIAVAKAMGMLFDSSNNPISPEVQSGSAGSVGPLSDGPASVGPLSVGPASVGPASIGSAVTCEGSPEFIVETKSEIDGILYVGGAGTKLAKASTCTFVKARRDMTGAQINVGAYVTCLGNPAFRVETISEINGSWYVGSAGLKPISASTCRLVKPLETAATPIKPGESVSF